MKKLLLITALALVAAAGCRREDIREFTVKIPALTEANRKTVVEALSKYGGIRKDSYVWDFKARTLTLRYDSMQIAKTNIRMAIAEKGIEVDFEDNRNGGKEGK